MTLPKSKRVCEYKNDEDLYFTDCGGIWDEANYPVDGMKYCPFCGMLIKEVRGV
jgi:hypothetical protein